MRILINIWIHFFNINLTEDTGTIKTEARLNFVDLAGSEKVSNHHETSEDKEVQKLIIYRFMMNNY